MELLRSCLGIRYHQLPPLNTWRLLGCAHLSVYRQHVEDMVQQQNILSIPVIWRAKKFVLELSLEAPVLELGEELRKLTNVKANTLRLIVPQSARKSSKLWTPFSDEHFCISLQDAGITHVWFYNLNKFLFVHET